jgi:hypothetical protein
MDPHACWKRLLDAVRERDWEEAAFAAEDLERWYRMAGDAGLNYDLYVSIASRLRKRKAVIEKLHALRHAFARAAVRDHRLAGKGTAA